MNVGMLWLDTDSEADLGRRVERAAAYYAEKYGRRANVCVLHPDAVAEAPANWPPDLSLRVRPDALRRHFWIGVDDGVGAAA